MFHSQLVGGTSIQFKTIGDMTYTVTPQDIGKTLKFGQNAIITVGSLNVVEGSLFTIENRCNHVWSFGISCRWYPLS